MKEIKLKNQTLQLIWDEYFWIGDIKLPSWKGYQCRHGRFNSVNSENPSDGTVKIYIDEENDKSNIKQIAIDSIEWILTHDCEIHDSIIERLFNEYKEIQEYFGFDKDEKNEIMPDISSKEDLKKLIGLSNVHIHGLEKNNMPYIGYEFGCTWEDEHGLGAMLCGTDVIDMGGADTSILKWIAEKDMKKMNP